MHYKGHLRDRPGNARRKVRFTLTNEQGGSFSALILASHARLLILLKLARDEDPDYHPDDPWTGGWLSYEELIRRVETQTEWELDRKAVIAMFCRMVRLVKNAALQAGHQEFDIVYRDGGAVKLAVEVKVDSRLQQLLLPVQKEEGDAGVDGDWS